MSDELSNGLQGHVVGFIFRDQVAMAVLIKFNDTNIGKENRLRCKYDLSNFPQYSVPIERIEAMFSLSKSKKNIQATRKQFPIRLCWAFTVHKIQGQSLEQECISFEENFTNGQAYVALSRATSLNELFLSEFSKKKICVSSVVKKEMTRLQQIQTDEPLLFKETNIDNIIASLLIARSAKHHFSDILEDPILLSADIICLTEANFYSGDNMKIDKYNCTQLPMDANSNTMCQRISQNRSHLCC